MAMFEGSGAAGFGTMTPPPQRRKPRRGTVAGIWALVVALVCLLGMSFLPSGFVIEQPGPVYDTLGEVTRTDLSVVPLIEIEGAETYESTGSLDLLTVQVRGNADQRPSWFDLALAWLNPSNAIVPVEQLFPSGTTTEQRSAQSAELMVDSQSDATAAALTALGIDYTSEVAVYTVDEEGGSAGVLQADDVILAVDGTPVSTVAAVRTAVGASGGAPVDLEIRRSDETMAVTVVPQESTIDGAQTWVLGITAAEQRSFPIDVTIQLDNVGGPSAGMMFALGIIDMLSPEDLTGGAHVAGTGTIDAEGEVGAIGGIRQKLYGAAGAGAEYFLAPSSNCDEVVGHVPDGLRVFAVSTLDDSLTVLETIRDGGDLDALATCTAQ